MMRRKARELALQILFQMDLSGHDLERALADAVEREEPAPAVKEFAERLVRGFAAHREEIDAEIARRSREWTLERLAAVDRSILRIAIYELLYSEDVPGSVVANEAVELAKSYSTEDSGRFVNGIVGAMIRERAGVPAQAEVPATAGE